MPERPNSSHAIGARCLQLSGTFRRDASDGYYGQSQPGGLSHQPWAAGRPMRVARRVVDASDNEKIGPLFDRGVCFRDAMYRPSNPSVQQYSPGIGRREIARSELNAVDADCCRYVRTSAHQYRRLGWSR
jgi:hypothetical protein